MADPTAEHLRTGSRRDERSDSEHRLKSQPRAVHLLIKAIISSLSLALVASGLVGVWTEVSYAAGFAVTAQGAPASGKSGAFIAQADDPSAVYYNPAGISQLTGPQLLVGSSIIVPWMAYHPDLVGPRSDQESQTFFLPHFYFTHPLSQHFTAGLGLFVPFGLATDWPTDWQGRFQVTFASLRAAVVRPTVAWHPVEWLSIAGGPDLAYVTIEQRRRINLSRVGEDLGIGPLAGNPEGTVSLKGDGQALGFHGGVLIGASDVWQVGLNFRSRLHAEIKEGRVDFEIPVPAFQPAFPDGRARTEVDLPPSVGMGVLVRPRPQWNIEVDATWTGWSTVNELVVDFNQGLPVPRETTPFSWRNSVAYSIGTEYRWASHVLRGGYTYDRTPIPDDTVSPVIADGNRQYFTLGAGLIRDQWDLNIGYQLLLFERVKSNAMGSNYSSAGNPPGIPAIDGRANGLYDTYSHTIGLSLTKRF